MPTSTRKSTGQTRNRPHIPYKHDDYQHGKRTGMNVEVVDRNSDDFEPFDKVISQADARTPPRVRRKKKQTQLSPIDDGDTNGEISMDLDDSMDPYDSPMAYYSNQRVPAAPNSIRRVGSTSRPVRHSPDTDYDQLPSPRAASSRRQSRASVKSAGPSRLSQSFVAAYDETDIPGGSGSEDDDDDEGVGFVPQLSLPPPSPEGPSFSQLDQDEDEEEEDQIESVIFSPNKSVDKGKRRSTAADESTSSRSGRKSRRTADEEEDDEGESSRRSESKKGRKSRAQEEEEVEEEIAQAMNDVDMEDPEEAPSPPRHLSDIAEEPEEDQQGPDEEQEEEQEEEPQPVKKTKKSRKRESMTENAEPGRPKKKPRIVSVAAKGRGRTRTPLADKTPEPHVIRLRSVSPENPDGLRRSRRYRYKPLEYWRLEKVVYGRVDEEDEENHKPKLVAPIREIVRLPKEEVQPLGGKKSRKRRAKSKSKTVGPEVDPESDPEDQVYNPEEGWDAGTKPQGHVLDYTTKVDVERRVAYTASMVVPAGDGPWKFQKIFGDGDFIAAGHLIIPVGSEKPSKGTKDNTYVFYVIEGAVTLKVHTTSFVVCTGGCFLVPRGNIYYIKNICSRTVKLFFAQARKIPAGVEEAHLLPKVRDSMEGPDRDSTVPRDNQAETSKQGAKRLAK